MNGTMDLTYEKHKEFSNFENVKRFDIWTKVEFIKLLDCVKYFPMGIEVFSNTLEDISVFVIVPKSDFIDSSLYLVKPFSLILWICCFIYLILGSLIVFLTFYKTKKKIDFWKIFNQLLRSLLSQSFSGSLQGFQISFIYLLAILFGFIMAVWYSALLGSFLTTFIRKPQITSVEQLKASNLKILHEEIDISQYFGYKELQDYFVICNVHDLKRAMWTGNRSYGHLVPSIMWKLSSLSEKFIIIKNFNLETSYLRIIWRFNSYYKKQFDRYINILQNTGLYNYWKELNIRELSKFNISDINFPFKNRLYIQSHILRILDLKYFEYPFKFISIGWLIGILCFIFECLWICIKIICFYEMFNKYI